jgi:hypothetical protein
MCDRWRNSFENFYADMGSRPGSEYSIDRIDNDGNYEPDNCRWATCAVQNRNRRTNVRITLDGVSLTLVEWAERTGINRRTIQYRITRSGWSVERALTEPVNSR